MAGNRVLEFVVGVRDRATAGMRGIQRSLSRLLKPITVPVQMVAKGVSTVFNQLTNIRSGLLLVQGAFQKIGDVAKKVWGSVTEYFKYESMEKSFQVLFKDLEKGKEHMEMVRKLGDTPPFSLEATVTASKELHKFSDGLLNTKEMLELVGDTAFAKNQSIETVASTIGRAFALIRDNEPFTRAGMMLRNMGILTPAVVAEITKLQDAGATNAEIWNKVTEALQENSGATKTLMETGEGLVGAVESQWTNAVREFGKAFSDLAKTELEYLMLRLKKLREDGTIKKWAEEAKDAIQPLVSMIMNLFDGESRELTLNASWDYLRDIFEFGGKTIMLAGDYFISKLTEGVRRRAGGLWEMAKFGGREFVKFSGKINPFYKIADDALEKLSPTGKTFTERLDEMTWKTLDGSKTAKSEWEKEFKLLTDSIKKSGEDFKKAVAEASEIRTSKAKEEPETPRRQKGRLGRDLTPEQELEVELARKQAEKDAERKALAEFENAKQRAEEKAKELAGLEKELAGLEKEEKGLAMADVDARLEQNKEAKKQAREEARFERRLKHYRAEEERAGGDRSRLSSRARAVLALADEREAKEKRQKELEDRIKDVREDAKKMAESTANMEASLKDLVASSENTEKYLKENLEIKD